MSEITWLGHACFRIKSKDATIIADPYEKSAGLGTLNQKADIVTVSHDNPGHNAAALVKGEPYVVRGPGEFETRGVFVTGVWSYADDAKGAQRGRNCIFLFHLDDLVVCHLGSLAHTLNSQQVDALGEVNVLLVPVDDQTLTPARAAEVISQLEPHIVIPMHYSTANGSAAETLEKFTKEMGLKEYTPQDKLVAKSSEFDEGTRVVVLEARS
ncbi:MAG TPA: MBL fold metallo-hydrolase [Chloroflexia bacterium]|nr:MBL fold metallo-hydrolase [Chloroflexia bacterium]